MVSLLSYVIQWNIEIAITVHGIRSGMAGTIQLRDPEAFYFKFHKTDEWLKWYKRFEEFWIASGLSAESQSRQVSSLLYCMGEEAKDVLTSNNITEDEKKS